MDISWIRECDLVVIPGISGMRNNISSAGARRLDGVRLQRPVADVDQMNRLLDNDIARQHPIPIPAANSEFIRRHVGHGKIADPRRVIVCGDGANLPQRALLNVPDHLHKRRCASNLEADFQADMSLCALANLEGLFRLRHVYADWLLAVNVLATTNRGIEMLHVKPRCR